MKQPPSDRVDFPLAVEIEINHDCNRACAYCPNSETERLEQGGMDPDLFRLVMTQLREIGHKGRVSYHFYNEPLLSRRLDEFVLLTREYLPACRIEIFTNGTLLDGRRLNGLLDLGVDKFTVTQHVNADLSAFEEAYAALSVERRSRIRYGNYRNLILTNRGGMLKGVGPRDVVPPLRLPCFMPVCAMVITLKGNVVPCFEDYRQVNAMGNVRETHLRDIWKSEKYVRFRTAAREGRRSEHPVCRECNNRLMIS